MLRKAIAPLATQQASENSDCYLKNQPNYKSPILHVAPMQAHNIPYVLKKSKITVIWHVTTICIHPGGFCYPQVVVWVRGAHNIAKESQVIVQVYCFVHSGFVFRN